MKKFLGVVSILLIAILIFGCNGTNNNAQVKLASQKLTNGINNIITQINKIDEVDNNKIQLDELLNDNYYFESTNETETDKKDDYSTEKNVLTNKNTPTRHKLNKNSTLNLNSNRNKHFNFVNTKTERNYNDLIYLSNNCCEVSNEFSTIKNELINNFN